MESYRHALTSALGIPFFEGNRIEILRNGDRIFPAMLDAVASARERVDFLTYIYWRGDIAERFAGALADAARRGVAVRVILDGIGSIPMERRLVERMEESGVDLRWFRPVRRWLLPWEMTHRTHRKVLLCDGRVGFTGGVGVGEQWEGDARGPEEWRDTHFRIEGPAVQGLHGAFVGNWMEVAPDRGAFGAVPVTHRVGPASVQVVRSSAAISWSDMATLLHGLIGLAERSVRISTPYFVPDEPMVDRLVRSVESGTSIDVLVPGRYIDQRVAQVAGEDHYEELLAAGVGIWEYQPTMIHQKILVVDSRVVAIGSGNLNQRSLRQDDEVQLVVVDPAFTTEIDSLLDEDWRLAERVAPGQWKRRGLLQRVAETASRPFRRQL